MECFDAFVRWAVSKLPICPKTSWYMYVHRIQNTMYICLCLFVACHLCCLCEHYWCVYLYWEWKWGEWSGLILKRWNCLVPTSGANIEEECDEESIPSDDTALSLSLSVPLILKILMIAFRCKLSQW